MASFFPKPGLERQDPFIRLHAVNVYVRNHDRSLRFYLDQLGFQLAIDARMESGDRWVAVAPPDGSAVLNLVEARPDSHEYKLIGRNTHVSFVTEDVAAKFQEWRIGGAIPAHTPAAPHQI